MTLQVGQNFSTGSCHQGPNDAVMPHHKGAGVAEADIQKNGDDLMGLRTGRNEYQTAGK